MLTKKQLVIICLISSIIYHFIFHFEEYGASLGNSIFNANSLLAWASVFILIFLYTWTSWRSDLKGNIALIIFDLLILWIFISCFRSIIDPRGSSEWKNFLLSPWTGLSLFPAFFFLIGVNLKYFYSVNLILTSYCIISWVISLFFINHSELQAFLLMPIFYIIVTFPLQSSPNRILTLIISLTVIITSWTNRAGVMRILVSYLIVVIYYIITQLNFSKTIINIILFCMLTLPFYFIYKGIKGENVFEKVLGYNTEGYGQKNLRADTRTLLYLEVFQDLKMNKAFVFGKGIDAGYVSYTFQTLSRKVVEVGFLQMLLKSGILGFLLYMTLIFSAIFKALTKSNNLFMKFLGLFLSSYFLMFFIENVLVYNLLNIVVWLVIGMCHSEALRNLNDNEIKTLFLYARSK